MGQAIRDLLARISSLEEAVKQNRADVAAAEDRAARAEARAARLETATGNLAAAVVDPKPISRRSLLTKAAAAGAVGVGALVATTRGAAAATGGNMILGASGDTANANLAENATEVHLDSGNPGVILLANDTAFHPSAAAYPAAVAGWGLSRNGVYGYSENGSYGVVGVAPSGTGLYALGSHAQLTLQNIYTSAYGPPTTNAHAAGDIWIDAKQTVWLCIGAGTPGTFVPLQTGGVGNAFKQAISTQQYHLANSDGVTWTDIDATNLIINVTPNFNCAAILTANADLWTANSGFNQDIGIFVSGGAFGSGQIVAWKESGGSAGTFSPNAAFVETSATLAAGTAYVIKLQWKTNKNASGATIYAGAGPIPAGSSTFSPTRLGALLIVTA